jgi:MFS family permease
LALIIGGKVIGWAMQAPPITLPFFGLIKPWQLAFLAVGIPGILLALLLLTVREPRRRQAPSVGPQKSIGDTFRYMWARRKAYGSLILAFSVLGMIMNCYQIWGVQYFVRELKLSVPEAGLRVGLAIAVCGSLGVLVGGWLTDRWRSQGRLDATLRVGLTAAICVLPFAAACTLMGDLTLSTLMLQPIGFFTAFAFGAGAAAIVMVTPDEMRAQASAIYLWFINMIGIGLAPFLTAVLTEHVFGNDVAVGKSVAIVSGGAALIAAMIFAWGLPHFRAEIRARESLRS